jgi:ribosome-associated protein
MIDVTKEINFQTTRSGGKGGQNVNKVETAVIGSFHVDSSELLTGNQKQILRAKLFNRINTDGFLQVKSQIHRTQLANKEEVIERINELIFRALKKKKKRISTKPSKESREKRLESKKKNAETKSHRRKFRPGDY